MVERLVLVENHEHILHLFAQKANDLVPLVLVPSSAVPVVMPLRPDVFLNLRFRIGAEPSMVATTLRPKRTQLSP